MVVDVRAQGGTVGTVGCVEDGEDFFIVGLARGILGAACARSWCSIGVAGDVIERGLWICWAVLGDVADCFEDAVGTADGGSFSESWEVGLMCSRSVHEG